MKSKLTSIVLFLMLIAPVIGTYSWLQCKKATVKKEVKKQLIAGKDKEELILLKFTKKEAVTQLHWEHSREFEYNNLMYDIVKTETKGDSIFYWCWLDHEETQLNQQLKNLVAQILVNDQQNKENQKRLITFYKSLYHSKQSAWHALINQTEPNTDVYTINWLSISFPPPVPPPRKG